MERFQKISGTFMQLPTFYIRVLRKVRLSVAAFQCDVVCGYELC